MARAKKCLFPGGCERMTRSEIGLCPEHKLRKGRRIRSSQPSRAPALDTWLTNINNSAPILALRTRLGNVKNVASISTLALSIVIGVLTCCLVARFTLHKPLGGDGAQDIETARSLGTSFSYEPIYIPRHVYDPYVSTNGPIQYIAGIAYALSHHNIDVALVAGTVSATVVLLIGLMLLRPWFSVIALGLMFIWPMYSYLGTSFLGEIWAAGAVLIALAILERIKVMLTPSMLFSDKRLWLACACFAAAVATKLEIALAVIPIIFAAVYDQLTPRGWNEIARNVLRSITVAAIVSVISGILFLLQFAISVLHTVRSLMGTVAIPGIFLNFVKGQIVQAGFQPPGLGALTHLADFSSHLMLLLVVIAAVVLVVSRPSYGLLVVVTGVVWFNYGYALPPAWERRLLPMFLIILVLGLRETLRLVARAANKRRLPASMFEALLMTVIVLLVLVANPVIGAPAVPAADDERQYAVQVGVLSEAQLNYHYGPDLIGKLREHRYVVTAEWYGQFPEISDFWDLQFYDRMALENAHLWNQDVVLLFDKTLSVEPVTFGPITTESGNCASIIYADADGRLVLCSVRRDVPLDYQPPTSSIVPPGAKMHAVSLESSRWNLSTNMHRALGGPHGATDYEYTGTGTIDGNEIATLSVPVQPGRIYVFSAWVDPSGILERDGENGQFDLGVGTADGKASYVTTYDPVGPPARYSTDPWLCPPHVTRVQLGMQLVWTTVAKGQKLRFSRPILSDTSPAHASKARTGRNE